VDLAWGRLLGSGEPIKVNAMLHVAMQMLIFLPLCFGALLIGTSALAMQGFAAWNLWRPEYSIDPDNLHVPFWAMPHCIGGWKLG